MSNSWLCSATPDQAIIVANGVVREGQGPCWKLNCLSSRLNRYIDSVAISCAASPQISQKHISHVGLWVRVSCVNSGVINIENSIRGKSCSLILWLISNRGSS